jgi:hypothetical protein
VFFFFERNATNPEHRQECLCLDLTEAFRDSVVLDYAGVRGSESSAGQRQQLIDLIGQYVNNMDDGHARVKMDEVRTG